MNVVILVILGLVGIIERDIYFWRKPEDAVGNSGIRITFSGISLFIFTKSLEATIRYRRIS